MKLTVDEYILDKYNLSLNEFLVLYLSANSVNIKSCMESLIQKGLAYKDMFYENSIVVSNNIKDTVSSIIIESDKNIIDKDQQFTDLANKLRELYPAVH